jgi:hypothetical protein
LSLSLCIQQTLDQQTFSSRWNPYWKEEEIKENSLGVMYKKWIKVLLNGQSPVAPK